MSSLMEKKITLNTMKMGTIIRLTNGKEFEFIRMKKTKFLARHNGSMYDVPMNMFAEVVSESTKVPFDASSLREGELFYILNNQQEAVVFSYQYMINVDKVQAKNPVTGQGYRIGSTMIEGRVKELV